MIFIKVLIISCIAISILSGNSFSLHSVKKDAIGKIVKKKKNTKVIIATGYGLTKEKALKNAFTSAIQQYVGVIVDSEAILKNDKLIKDEVLTASNGFIKSYDEISSNMNDGLFEVKIKAIVKSQKIHDKIKSLKIAKVAFNSDVNGKNLLAEISTKERSKKDAQKILKKVIKNLFSPSSIQEMLNIKILNVKVEKNKIKNNQIPVVIEYSLNIDYNIYLKKIETIENTFKNLGAKLYKRVDLPYIEHHLSYYDQLCIKNRKKISKSTETDLGIIKRYGQGYKLDVWSFPQSWKKTDDIYKDIYDLENICIRDFLQIVLELKDSKGKTLVADALSNDICNVLYTSYSNLDNYRYYTPKSYGVAVFAPFFTKKNSALVKYKTTQMVDLKNIDKIKNISIELEEI